jgi:hypothetical protein
MTGIAAAGLLALIAAGAYFAPSVVAFARQVPNARRVLIINALAGWSVAGWVAALVMATRARPSRAGGQALSGASILPAVQAGGLRDVTVSRSPADAPPWRSSPPAR